MTKEFALAFVAIFAALDIVGTLPLYVSMTHGLPVTARKRTANTSMWVALVVAVLFLFAGKLLFRFLGIEIFDFKIAGGLVLLLVSLADLLEGPEAIQRSSGSTGIVPLAVPLITGPGVLTTVILQVDYVGYIATLVCLIINYAIAWGLLRKATSITRVIGDDGATVISKLAALMLAAIAVAMIRAGVFDTIHFFH